MSSETNSFAAAPTQETPVVALTLPKSSDLTKAIWATGRRKTAIAQVRLTASKNASKISVNQLSLDGYFKGNHHQAMVATQSLQLINNFSGYDLLIRVKGGGISGQAEAIRHGIARALSHLDVKVKQKMRKEGYLTRDSRAVERKKSGQPKARKRFQYSKR